MSELVERSYKIMIYGLEQKKYNSSRRRVQVAKLRSTLLPT